MKHVLVYSGTTSCIKFVVSKIPRWWSSGITKCFIIKSKQTAAMINQTGPSVDCTSKKKNGLIMNLALMPHETMTLGDLNWTG